MPFLPKPPEPVDSVDMLGMKNAGLKLMFWSLFGFLLWEFFRRQGFDHDWRSLFWIVVVSAVFAMQSAVGFNKMIVSLLNDHREETYLSDLEALKNAQPFTHLERDENGEFQGKRRPLYDEQMGVERR